MIRLLRDGARLDGRERALAARALGWVLLARIFVALAPFGAVRAVLHRIPRRRRASATVGECERALRRAARLLPASRCLALACAGAALLRREGRESLMTIHVSVAAGRPFEAHAALVAEGLVVTGAGTGMEWPVVLRDRITA